MQISRVQAAVCQVQSLADTSLLAAQHSKALEVMPVNGSIASWRTSQAVRPEKQLTK